MRSRIVDRIRLGIALSFGSLAAMVALTSAVAYAAVPDTSITTHPSNPSNVATPAFQFTSDVAATFQCKVDAGSYSSCTSPYTTPMLGDTSHTFSVRATNIDGTDPSPATYVWTIDTDPPDTMITRLGATPALPMTNFILTSNETVTFECKLDAGAYAACGASYTTLPLRSGSHTLLVRATDLAGNVDPSPASHTWTVDSTGIDSDNDGILDDEEYAGPVNGDGDQDGIPDAGEANVASFVNPVTGKYEVLATSCNSLSAIQVGGESSEEPDAAYSYPFGLTSFHITCSGPGIIATISQLFADFSGTNKYVLRKWSSGEPYKTIPGFVLNGVLLDDTIGFRVSYQIADGGPYDEDGTPNTVIVDPSGLALPIPAAPDTGLAAVSFIPAVGLLLCGAASAGLLMVRQVRAKRI